MNRSMRITFVNGLYPPYGAAGAENTLRALVTRLAGGGHDCTVVTLTPGREREYRTIDDIPVHYLPLANVYWPHGGDRPRSRRPLFQALDAYNPIMRRRLETVLEALRPD